MSSASRDSESSAACLISSCRRALDRSQRRTISNRKPASMPAMARADWLLRTSDTRSRRSVMVRKLSEMDGLERSKRERGAGVFGLFCFFKNKDALWGGHDDKAADH